MKNYLALISSIGLLISAAPVWASTPDIVFKEEKACPGQQEEFRKALTLEPTMADRFSKTQDGKIAVLIDPSEDSYQEFDVPLGDNGPRPTGSRILSSPFTNPYNWGSWALNSKIVNGQCVVIKAADIVDSVHYWNNKNNLISISLQKSNKVTASKDDVTIGPLKSPPGAMIQGPFPGPKPLDSEDTSNFQQPGGQGNVGVMQGQNASKN
jgi:hypothetical protein